MLPQGPHSNPYADWMPPACTHRINWGKNKKILHKCTSIVYRENMKKDTGFRIRVQRDLREKFLEICRAQDKPAAQVLREYMREFVEGHETANDPKKTKNKDKA